MGKLRLAVLGVCLSAVASCATNPPPLQWPKCGAECLSRPAPTASVSACCPRCRSGAHGTAARPTASRQHACSVPVVATAGASAPPGHLTVRADLPSSDPASRSRHIDPPSHHRSVCGEWQLLWRHKQPHGASQNGGGGGLLQEERNICAGLLSQQEIDCHCPSVLGPLGAHSEPCATSTTSPHRKKPSANGPGPCGTSWAT